MNAFVLPGGQIFVYTGLVDFVGAEDDGLACVIGHEMAHAIMRHSAEQLSLKTVWNGLNVAVIGAIWFLAGDGVAYFLMQAPNPN